VHTLVPGTTGRRTGQPRRTCPIYGTSGDDYVLVASKGGADLLRGPCKAAGVRPVTLHAARHSSVTAMRDAGVPDHVLAAWHGHDAYIMRKVYSHAQAEGLAAAGLAMEQLLTGSAGRV
jgi:integrase